MDGTAQSSSLPSRPNNNDNVTQPIINLNSNVEHFLLEHINFVYKTLRTQMMVGPPLVNDENERSELEKYRIELVQNLDERYRIFLAEFIEWSFQIPDWASDQHIRATLTPLLGLIKLLQDDAAFDDLAYKLAVNSVTRDNLINLLGVLEEPKECLFVIGILQTLATTFEPLEFGPGIMKKYCDLLIKFIENPSTNHREKTEAVVALKFVCSTPKGVEYALDCNVMAVFLKQMTAVPPEDRKTADGAAFYMCVYGLLSEILSSSPQAKALLREAYNVIDTADIPQDYIQLLEDLMAVGV